MVRLPIGVALYILTFAIISWAHPGHDHQHEAAERREYLKHHPRSLAHCAAKLKSQGHEAANLKRRQDLAEQIRRKRGLESYPYFKSRDLDSVLATSHRSNDTCPTLQTDPSCLFADDSSCILQPEVAEGPYYISGELIRRDITNGERGIELTLDIQVIDTTTCEPMSAIYVDIWHCNATGVYSGIVAAGNGDSSDSGNLNNTAFRGLQRTDEMGIVQFETMFPGHYRGRTNHIHILTLNDNTTILNPNGNTLSAESLEATHSGQIFFDQALQVIVESTEPYTLNRQALTTNDEDGILAVEARASDPVMEYILLGDSITDGILGWIGVGIDPTSPRVVNAAATYLEGDGGVGIDPTSSRVASAAATATSLEGDGSVQASFAHLWLWILGVVVAVAGGICAWV